MKLPDQPHIMQWAYDATSGQLSGAPVQKRHLSDMAGVFASKEAYVELRKTGDPLIYKVQTAEPARDCGDLHFGLGTLYPGRVGDEYYMTKGHFHAVRSTAEVYIGLRGAGYMLLEREDDSCPKLIEIGIGRIVYVPGNTAHRTINTGDEPLVYFGIFPANAGHDYESISKTNFRNLLIYSQGKPTLVKRET